MFSPIEVRYREAFDRVLRCRVAVKVLLSMRSVAIRAPQRGWLVTVKATKAAKQPRSEE